MNSHFLIASIVAISVCTVVSQQEIVAQESIVSPEFTLEGSLWEDMDIENIEDFLLQFARYPERAKSWELVGTVVAEFVVSTKGEVSDIQIINSVSPELDAEMIRLVEGTSGMWIPGSVDGFPAHLKKEVSLTFKPDPAYDLLKIAKEHMDKGNQALFENNDPKSALEHFNKSISILPYEKGLLSLRSLCYFEMGNKEKAREDWERIINLNLGERSQLETGYLIMKMKDLEGYEELQKALVVN